MRLGGPAKESSPPRSRIARSPLHLLKVLPFARPYLRQLWIGIACIAFVAMTYSINIMALLPVITLIADDQGIPSWVHQSIAEKRLGVVFSTADNAVMLVKIGGGSVLPAEVRRRDLLTQVDGRPCGPGEIFRHLAYVDPDQATGLTFIAAASNQPYEVHITPRPLSLPERAMRRAVTWLPQESTNPARMQTLVLILAGVLVIGCVGGVCRFFGEYLIAFVAGRALVDLRKRMFQRVLRLPLSYFAVHGTSDTVSRFVQDSQEIYRGVNFVFAKSLREPLKALFVFIVAMFIDWRITLITVVSAPLAAIIIRKFGKITRKANRRLLHEFGRMLSALEGALIGIRVVKGYAMESYERKHLHAVDRQMLTHQLRIERIDALSSPVFETVGAIIAALAILYFANQMFEGLLSFAKFGTLAACMAGMFDPVRKMSSFYNRVQRANAAVDRVFEVLELPDELGSAGRKPPLPPLRESIELRNVSFTYPGSDRPALDQVSLLIRKGERVAFVGANGSGKTTLLSMLMRFFDPQQGAVLFDGNDIRNFSISSLRNQISLVTQETIIFPDTLGNNIAYGNERLLRRIVLQRRHPERNYRLENEQHTIRQAAVAAYADEFIREKPDGYDTIVGEHGATLSGGQRQRIAIARAILRNAPIFIFDEATSQIDAESEQKIHDAVERFLEGRTALIIAHRLSTILQADRIFVLERGKIVDVGPHEELVQRCQLYQTLCNSQMVDDTGERTARPTEIAVSKGG